MPKKPTYLRVLTAALLVLWIIFIFSNSLQTGAVSTERSQPLTENLNRFLHRFFSFTITETFLRKMGHLLEFALLGFLLSLNLFVYTKKRKENFIYALFAGLLVCVIDESLQLFTPNRSAEVKDILIDFSGVLLGLLCFMVLFALLQRRKKKKKVKNRLLFLV